MPKISIRRTSQTRHGHLQRQARQRQCCSVRLRKQLFSVFLNSFQRTFPKQHWHSQRQVWHHQSFSPSDHQSFSRRSNQHQSSACTLHFARRFCGLIRQIQCTGPCEHGMGIRKGGAGIADAVLCDCSQCTAVHARVQPTEPGEYSMGICACKPGFLGPF